MIQELLQDPDILIALEKQIYSDPVRFQSNNTSDSEKIIYKDLKIKVVESGSSRPVSRAMISIDSIGRTAVCDHDGGVCLSDLASGRYLMDIVSSGFIATTIVICIEGPEIHEIYVEMISNI